MMCDCGSSSQQRVAIDIHGRKAGYFEQTFVTQQAKFSRSSRQRRFHRRTRRDMLLIRCFLVLAVMSTIDSGTTKNLIKCRQEKMCGEEKYTTLSSSPEWIFQNDNCTSMNNITIIVTKYSRPDRCASGGDCYIRGAFERNGTASYFRDYFTKFGKCVFQRFDGTQFKVYIQNVGNCSCSVNLTFEFCFNGQCNAEEEEEEEREGEGVGGGEGGEEEEEREGEEVGGGEGGEEEGDEEEGGGEGGGEEKGGEEKEKKEDRSTEDSMTSKPTQAIATEEAKNRKSINTADDTKTQAATSQSLTTSHSLSPTNKSPTEYITDESTRIQQDHWKIILPIVLGAIVIVIVLVVLLRCRRKKSVNSGKRASNTSADQEVAEVVVNDIYNMQ